MMTDQEQVQEQPKEEMTEQITDRAPTGIAGLDELIEGGFPRGSMVLLAGSAGAGKTIASAHFLYHGAKNLSENGIYVSFAERRAFFIENMKRFGLDFEELRNQAKFEFLDLITTREDTISSMLGLISKQLKELEAKRLVIDSFTALAQAFHERIDARILLHLLSKLFSKNGCTTLLLVELPTGTGTLGLGFEEFVADGIVLFETIDEKEGIRKRAVVRKMRGTNHNMNFSHIVISDHGMSLMPYVP